MVVDTQKVVINWRHGGFSLSDEADILIDSLQRVFKIIDPKATWQILNLDRINYLRNSPFLVYAVEKLRDRANGKFAALKVVEIPVDVDWQIDDYDGKEWVAETHRTWD